MTTTHENNSEEDSSRVPHGHEFEYEGETHHIIGFKGENFLTIIPEEDALNEYEVPRDEVTA